MAATLPPRPANLNGEPVVWSKGPPPKVLGVSISGLPGWREKLFWRLQICGWSVAAVLSTFFVALGPFHIEHALLLALTRNVFGFTATLGMRCVFRALRRRSSSVWIWALVVLPLSALASFFDGLMMLFVARQLGVDFASVSLGRLVAASTFMRWVLYLLWSILYFGINYWIEVQHEQLRIARRDAENRTNELRLLRAQVNPHFLFNALTSIQAVAGDRQRAEPLIQAFGDYLRFSLEGRRDMLPLGVELEALENYLQVEKVRFDSRLEYVIDASPAARKVSVPIALVQPLVENAMKFAQKSGIWPLRVAIRASLEGDRLHVTVANTGYWVEFDESSSTGIGLDNLRRRLNLLFGAEAELDVAAVGDQVIASVIVPAS
ncbi:histidine kinase [Terrimicrobium sacchariphilum]|uniref:Histidine kinase n=1 Tax=Terrimicrobium sacchariphilum TaxID=690879 RepID=A0A146G208_TERSA|nr:histidine kinase [Terrimicrobium sacchariphilum]GAT31899.1 histidine kinase [Terrimicrobium sacchariphilum]